MGESDIEVIEGSARATMRLAIRRRQRLTEEAAHVSDLALSVAVQFTDHRTCFNEIGHRACHSCEDVVAAAEWIDREMDRAGVPGAARKLAHFKVEDYEPPYILQPLNDGDNK